VEKARPAASRLGHFGNAWDPVRRGRGYVEEREKDDRWGMFARFLTGRNELVDARHRRMPMCKRFRCLWSLDASC
jgi:hypothetical protein